MDPMSLSAVQLLYCSYNNLWEEVNAGVAPEERCALCWGPAAFRDGGVSATSGPLMAGEKLGSKWVRGTLTRRAWTDWRDAPLCEACGWAYSQWNNGGVLTARALYASPSLVLLLGAGQPVHRGVRVFFEEDSFKDAVLEALASGDTPYVLALSGFFSDPGVRNGILRAQACGSKEVVVFTCDGAQGWFPTGRLFGRGPDAFGRRGLGALVVEYLLGRKNAVGEENGDEKG